MRLAGFVLGIIIWKLSLSLVVIKLGLTPSLISSDNYVESRLDLWTDVLDLNFVKLTRETNGCEPATLVPGETYRTLNDVFEYTVKEVIHSSSHKRLPSASYSGTPLTNCSVDTMEIQATLSTHEMKFEATINCPLPENQILVLSSQSRVSIETKGTDDTIFNHTSKPLHMVLPRIVSVYDYHVFSQVLRTGQLSVPMFGNTMISAMYFQAKLEKQSEIHYTQGVLHGAFASLGYSEAIKELSKLSVLSIENYMRIWWSALLIDLGAESDSNVLTDAQLLNRKVPSIHGGIYGEKTKFMSPLPPIEPTRLNMQYRCTVMKWKSIGQLISDLLIDAAYVVAWVVIVVMVAARLGSFPTGKTNDQPEPENKI